MPRVREILSTLDLSKRDRMKRALPAEVRTAPADLVAIKTTFPSALKTQLEALYPKYSASLMGVVTEELLRYPPRPLTADDLEVTLRKCSCPLPVEAVTKIRTSKTTPRYLEAISTTRARLESNLLVGGGPRYEQEVHVGDVEGHPDIMNDLILFEVKTTTRLQESWLDFILQLFSYAALSPEHTHVCLVLPLHGTGWGYDVRRWEGRAEFRALLTGAADAPGRLNDALAAGMLLRARYHIGSHVHKDKSLANTVRALDPSYPWQVMLAPPRGTAFHITDGDLAATLEHIIHSGLRLFIHAPYTINLCRPHDDPETRKRTVEAEGHHIQSVRKNLRYARTCGARGLVVHLGNALKMPRERAVANMRENILLCLSDATPECPLLLETGVGEGTEVCWEMDQFIQFINSIDDPRFGVCVDSCHIWAAGFDPVEFTLAVLPKLKLIHFNDSKGERGCHADRHEVPGMGTIGLDTLQTLAEIADSHRIPMVRE